MSGGAAKELAVLRLNAGGTEWVAELAFAPDGKILAVAYQHAFNQIYLWDLSTSPPLPRHGLQRHLHGLTSMACAPDGRTVVSAGNDGRIYLSDTSSGATLRAWQLPGPIKGVAFAADGRHLATANGNGSVYIFRLADGPPRAQSADEAKKRQEDEAKRLGVLVQFTNSIGMKLNLIPAGRFLMGSPEGRDSEFPEWPRHEVALSRPFYLGAHEVTVGQFRRFMNETGHKTEAERDGGAFFLNSERSAAKRDPKLTWQAPGWKQDDNHPVVCVTWNDALAFCKWLGKREGKLYRLPTEAEWEYACRAGSQTDFHFGDNPKNPGRFAWYASNSGERANPVGQLEANASSTR